MVKIYTLFLFGKNRNGSIISKDLENDTFLLWEYLQGKEEEAS